MYVVDSTVCCGEGGRHGPPGPTGPTHLQHIIFLLWFTEGGQLRGGYMCVDVGVDWGGGGYVDVYCL